MIFLSEHPKIIIVDDDIATLEVYREYLELQSIQVVGVCRDGREAVDLYQKYSPDLIFIDVMMPKYDGFFALEKIRNQDSKIPLIMLTADLSEDTENRLLRLGVTKIIYKPFEMIELVEWYVFRPRLD